MPIRYEISVSRDRYLEIIGFTEYAFITGKIAKYSGILRGKRSLGEYIENFTFGKLAEEAFKEFLDVNFKIKVLTELGLADFAISDYLPDIVAMEKEGKWLPLKFWVDVKEVRRDQRWLLVPASSLTKRRYDAYIAVWVGLPDEHLALLTASIREVKEKIGDDWKKYLSELEKNVQEIPCRVIGFALWNDLENITKHEDVEAKKLLERKFGPKGCHYFDGETALYDPDDLTWKGAEVGKNTGIALGRLYKASAPNWKDFLEQLKSNKRIVPSIPLKYETKTGKIRAHSLPNICKPFTTKASDYREVHQMCMESQLEEINKKLGGLTRKSSWFQQALKEKTSQPKIKNWFSA